MSLEPAQRARLAAAKLAALVGRHFGDAERRPGSLPTGPALVAGEEAWLLLDREPVASFGSALVWAERQGATRVHLLAAEHTGILARRAGCFTPSPEIWRVEGTDLVRAEPEPVPRARPAEAAPGLAGLLVDHDLEVLVEAGVVRGEINGLEVARIVHGQTTAGVPIEAPVLEVGVGKADRELTAMLHGNLTPTEQLARVVDVVRRHRRAGAPTHPLNQLVKERWLRAVLVRHPDRIGVSSLRPIETALPRANLRDAGTAAAVGTRPSGEPVVVLCAVGIHLDLVPAAADTRLSIDPEAGLLLAVPARDAHPVTDALAARLDPPAEVVPVDDDWRNER